VWEEEDVHSEEEVRDLRRKLLGGLAIADVGSKRESETVGRLGARVEVIDERVNNQRHHIFADITNPLERGGGTQSSTVIFREEQSHGQISLKIFSIEAKHHPDSMKRSTICFSENFSAESSWTASIS
jgi:hypothetical protein